MVFRSTTGGGFVLIGTGLDTAEGVRDQVFRQSDRPWWWLKSTFLVRGATAQDRSERQVQAHSLTAGTAGHFQRKGF